ncbi:methyltransferase [Fusarium austroafricanum]|uniref:Methyltransferase n=1 Tax=Fusarium austroafricanum TaxID=2364996 RepID=A0A8H4NXD7_9HYPO|nr:methyltransferase [Fusarium austroafricanum]
MEIDLYDDAHKQSPPPDLIKDIHESNDKPSELAQPDFGLDSLAGLLASFAAAPLYLYSSLKGKFKVWDEILDGLPDSAFHGPTLDVGCGRGMVLLKTAQRKKRLSITSPAIGIDIFSTADQTGNSPAATYQNATCLDVVQQTVLHRASFTERLPFADGVFSLVTSSLAVHNVSKEGRAQAIADMARVCSPDGHIIIIDLYGHHAEYQKHLVGLGWNSVKVAMAGMRMMYGVWPCQVLTATRPSMGEQATGL